MTGTTTLNGQAQTLLDAIRNSSLTSGELVALGCSAFDRVDFRSVQMPAAIREIEPKLRSDAAEAYSEYMKSIAR